MTHAAIVLPGASYGPDMPGLAVPIDVLRARGGRITVITYPVSREEITDHITPQITTALEGATAVTLIAKSLGTSVFGDVRHLFPRTTQAVWITPLFHDPSVRTAVIAAGLRCLSVFGTEDSVHDPEGQAKVTSACNGVELAIDGAGHALVMSDEQRAQLRGAVESFIA